jgi:hypothetical protein
VNTPVIDRGVQFLRSRLDRSSAGFEHNHLVPGPRKLDGYNNPDRSAADNNDVTSGQLRGVYLVEFEDHASGNLRTRERSPWGLRSARKARALERSRFHPRS